MKLQNTSPRVERITLARDIAFFTAVAFSTTTRGSELTATLIQRILRLPNRSGLMFNFQWGKTHLGDRADHVLTVPYDDEHVAICPVRAVTQLVEIGKGVGWDISRGHLFSDISTGQDGVPLRASLSVTAPKMATALKMYAQAAGQTQEFSLQ